MIRIISILTVFCVLVAFCLQVYSSNDRGMKLKTATGGRVALIIGNSNYADSPLRNPENDARDIGTTLTASGFDVILKINADQREMDEAIREFGRKLKNNKVGLFYYAGHGMQIQGRNYLIPIKSKIESESDVRYEGIDAGKVLGKMEDAGNDLNIMILDACRNNPFARSFRSADKGLARMDAPKGTMIAYATAPGSVAADGEGRNGLFTQHLIENMKSKGLKLEEVLKLVRIAVVKETGSKQIPWESSSLTGDFYFNIVGSQVVNLQVQAAEPVAGSGQVHKALDTEEEFWHAVKESKKVEDFEKYLKAYPDGRFKSVAELRMSQFASNDNSVQIPTMSLMKGWWEAWQDEEGQGENSSEKRLDSSGNIIWQYSIVDQDFTVGCNLFVEAIAFRNKQIRIRLHSLHGNPIWLRLYSFVPGYSKDDDDDSYLPSGKWVGLQAGINTIILTNKDIKIPAWWMEEHNNPAIEFNPDDIRLIEFQVESDEQRESVSDTLRIESVDIR